MAFNYNNKLFLQKMEGEQDQKNLPQEENDYVKQLQEYEAQRQMQQEEEEA